MTSYERQRELIRYLKEKRFATVKEMTRVVWTSESTVRRDVKELEAKGYVKQIYGGAVLSEYENSVVPVSLRDSSNTAVKEELAKRAAGYLFDGATVILDGSSTVRRILKYASHVRDLKVITNNQRIFCECDLPEVTLYCTGGRFLSRSNIFVGSATEEYIRGVNADLVFFSGQALSDDGEISDASEEETSLRRVMLTRAKRRIFLCDSSKLGKRRTFTICQKDDVDDIICDKPMPWE